MKKGTVVLASITFSLILAALTTALVTDGVIVGEHIYGFALSMFVSAVVFIMGIILMVVSIMMIFGIIILNNNGFWPYQWSVNTFNEMMKDYPVTQDQIKSLLIVRIVLLIVCLAVLIMACIVTAQIKKARKADPSCRTKPARGFAIVSRILSITGLVVCSGALAILMFLVK